MTELHNFHGHIMSRAYDCAMSLSDDPDTKSGCVIITPDGEEIRGANKLPCGITLNHDRHIGEDRRRKYAHIEHCERDAIFAAGRNGISIVGATLYVNWIPCMDCARAIINSRIYSVIIHKEGQEMYEKLAGSNKGNDWHEYDSIGFMREAKVNVEVMSIKFSSPVKGRFRGVDFTL